MNHPRFAIVAQSALWACAFAAPVHAGPLADPTRPPAALVAPGGLAAAALPHRANLDTARAIAAAARAAEALQPPPPPAVVQGVQLRTGGSTSALVDGRTVKVGDALDGRTVLAIDAQGLLVKGPRGPERLWLLGGAPKQAAGSITDSQWARYQAVPAATGEGSTAGAEQPLNAAPGNQPDRQTAPGAQARPPTTTSAAPATAPVSLAGRTTP